MTRRERLRLIARKRAIQQALALKERQEAQHLALEDFPTFCGEALGLNITDAGDGEPWFDFSTPHTPYSRMFNFLTNRNGKYKALFAGRRTGKTYLWQAILTWRFILNREYRALIGSEKEETAVERCSKIRDYLSILDGVYGPFVTAKWAESKFIVKRPSGMGHPSCYTAGPKKGKTGGHPDLIVLDDVVGENAHESVDMQSRAVKWVTDKLIFQLGKDSEIWVIGTMWPGSKHLYRHIFDRIEGKPRLEKIAHGCHYHEGHTFDIMSFSSGYDPITKGGKAVFACLPIEFLRKQWGLNPTMSRCQYDNARLDNQDVDFGVNDITFMEPPGKWEYGKFTPKEPLRAYAVGDWGTSVRQSSDSSMSCWEILVKDTRDNAYVMYAKAGRLHPDTVVETLLDACAQCQREMGLAVEKIHVETTGPGAMYGPQIQKEAHARELPLMVVPIPRPSDTNARIMTSLHGPIKAGRLRYSPRLLNEAPDFCRMTDEGELTGVMVEEKLGYSSISNEKPDILDAESDIFALDKGGNRLCPPPEGEMRVKEVMPGGEKWVKFVNKDFASRASRYID